VEDNARDWIIQTGGVLDCFYFNSIKREVEGRLPDAVAALEVAGVVVVMFEFYSQRELSRIAVMKAELGQATEAALRQLPSWALPPCAQPVLFAYTDIEHARELAPLAPPVSVGTFAGYIGELEGGVDVFAGRRYIGSDHWDGAREYLNQLCDDDGGPIRPS